MLSEILCWVQGGNNWNCGDAKHADSDPALPTVLSASRQNKSVQEKQSNLYINHPTYSEMYIGHGAPWPNQC